MQSARVHGLWPRASGARTDWFNSCDILKEGSITPSDETLFPGVDWLIGNHSDELTPWIPVIAAR